MDTYRPLPFQMMSHTVHHGGVEGLLIATLAGLAIFLSLIPHSNAETVEPTEIEIHLNALEDYYLSGDEITFSNLYNPSDTIQIDNNPSCDYTLAIRY